MVKTKADKKENTNNEQAAPSGDVKIRRRATSDAPKKETASKAKIEKDPELEPKKSTAEVSEKKPVAKAENEATTKEPKAAKKVETTEKAKAQTAEKKATKKASEQKPTPSAKIITRPEDLKAPAKVEEIKTEIVEQAKNVEETKKTPATQEAVVQEKSAQEIVLEKIAQEDTKEQFVKAAKVPVEKTETVAPVEQEKNAEKAEPQKAQPAASASPEQDDADKAKKSDDDKDRKRAKKKRPEPVVQTQVRVISRPDPVQAAEQKKEAENRAAGERNQYDRRPRYDGDNRDNRNFGNRDGRPDNRGSRDGGRPSDGRSDYRGARPDYRGARPNDGRPGGARPNDGRPGGARPNDGRPGGARPNDGRPGGARPNDGRPGGARPGDGRDGRSDNRPGGARPGARPGGARPGARPGGPRPDSPVPVFESDTQSKKKRNKNKKSGADYEFIGTGRNVMDDDGDMPRMRQNRRRKKEIKQAPTTTQPLKAAKRKIRIEEAIRVADMAHQMGLKAGEIIKVLFNLGIVATINSSLDVDTAAIVAAEFEYEVEKVGFTEESYLVPTEADKPEDLKLRPPVVTIMGHVDHGKTSLLDAIRKTNVTGGEAGGITQHIGAYHVKTKRGEIVFLDTPGHEAFTTMRARGAQVTDLVVLVVAADDGVMEQTREAINHAKAADVPIMVAVNKMDKPDANPDRVMQELASLGLQAEDWGGDVVTAKVSAKTRDGLDDLLELIALQAELLELKANPNKLARGHIVEAKLDKGRGPVATVLIQEGTLKQGDNFVCGVFSGRVRAMFNDQGRKVKEAGPSIPVEVQGFDGVPEAGEEFICLTDEKLARRIAEARAIKQRERELAKESRVTLETFLSRKADDKEAQVLNLVLKADVQGSLEAITESVRKLSTDKVRIEIIHTGAGAITESDILLASASEAIVIGFNVRPTAKVKEIAENEKVDIRFYDIIYKLVDEIRSAMTGMLAPVEKEVYLGQAVVRETFSVPKIGMIAGSHVDDGKLTRAALVRLLRDGVVIYTGKISSLKRFKDDAKEVLKGYECGVGLENYNDLKVGDIIEAYEIVNEAASL